MAWIPFFYDAWPPGGGGAVAFVRRQTVQGTAANPVVLTIPTANTVGNGLFLFVGAKAGSANTISAVTDNVGHTWTKNGELQTTASSNRGAWWYVGTSTGVVTSISVTLAATSTTIPISGVLFEVSGNDTASPISASNYQSDTVSDVTYDSGALTPTVDNCLVLSGATWGSTGTVTSLTAAGTLAGSESYLQGSATLHGIGSAYVAQTTAALVTATYTSSRISTSMGALLAIKPAGGITAVIKQGTWRWYSDATPDASLVALAAENTAPTLTAAQIQNGIVRLRVQLDETAGGVGAGAVQVQYSRDQTNWISIPDQTIGSNQAGKWFRWANGAATANGAVGTNVLTGTTASGTYLEASGVTATVAASSKTEFDLAILAHWPPPLSLAYFRITVAGVPIALDTGATAISLNTSSIADRPYTVGRYGDNTSASGPRELRYGPWNRLWHDGARWWIFWNEYDQTSGDGLSYAYWDGTGTPTAGGNWTKAVVTNTTSSRTGRNNQAFATIGGTKTVVTLQNSSSGAFNIRRGVIDTTTITWDAEVAVAAATFGRQTHVAIDDGGYIWVGGVEGASTRVWAQRSTNPLTSTGWTSGFNARFFLTDADLVDGDVFSLTGLGSGAALACWSQETAPRDHSASLLSATAFGTPTVITAARQDWGVARSGSYVWLSHRLGVDKTFNWGLRRYDIAGGTWSAVTNPGYGASSSDDDGLVVTADGTDVYVFGTFEGTGNGDRLIQYGKYTGTGTAGAWGSLTALSPSDRGNGDGITGASASGGGKIVVGFEFGDDELAGTAFAVEYHVLAMSSAHPLSAAVVGSSAADALRITTSQALAASVAASSAADATRVTTSQALTATVAGSSATSATQIIVGHAPTATVVGSSTAAASSLTVGHALTAASVGSSAAASTRITTSQALSASVVAASAADATRITTSQALSAAVVGSSAGAADLNIGGQTHALTAAVTGSSAAAALRLTLSQPLSAPIAASSAASATRVDVGHALSAAPAGASTATALRVTVGHPATASVVGSSASVATQITVGHPLASAPAGSSAAAATRITTSQALTTSVVASSSATASSITVGHPITASVAGSRASAADLAVSGQAHALTATVAGSSAAASSSLRVGHVLSASAVGDSAGTATALRLSHPLTASAVASSLATATALRLAPVLTASVVGASAVGATSLRLSHPLASSVAGASTASATQLRLAHALSSLIAGSSSALAMLQPVEADLVLTALLLYEGAAPSTLLDSADSFALVPGGYTASLIGFTS